MVYFFYFHLIYLDLFGFDFKIRYPDNLFEIRKGSIGMSIKFEAPLSLSDVINTILNIALK